MKSFSEEQEQVFRNHRLQLRLVVVRLFFLNRSAPTQLEDANWSIAASRCIAVKQDSLLDCLSPTPSCGGEATNLKYF